MKVVILCGGKGTRLHEETEFRPKPLVMVGDRPILWHIMRLYSHYGYNEFILCLGYKGEMIKQYFLNHDELAHDFTLTMGADGRHVEHHDKKTPDWKITFVDTGLECETGSRIARIKKYIGDDEDFFLTYGDGVADVNIRELAQFHKAHGKTVTMTGVKPPNPFGVIESDGDTVTGFAEKPPIQHWTNGGFFVCSQPVFNELSPDGACVFEQGPLQAFAASSNLAMYKHEKFWHCVDTLKHMQGLNTLYKNGTRPWMVWEGDEMQA